MLRSSLCYKERASPFGRPFIALRSYCVSRVWLLDSMSIPYQLLDFVSVDHQGVAAVVRAGRAATTSYIGVVLVTCPNSLCG